MSDPVIRPRASLIRVYDADTYLLLLDLHGLGLGEPGCETAWVRLRDFSARELSDTALDDPKGLGRLNGPAARTVAQQVLERAQEIVVELAGPLGAGRMSFDRHVAAVFVDGQSLGEVLAAEHAVSAGKFKGEPLRR